MNSSTKFFGFLLLLISLECCASPAHSQTDSVVLTPHSKVSFILSGGVVANHGGSVGGIVDLSIIKDGNVFGMSFTSVDTGKVITYKVRFGEEVAFAADLWHDVALRYGRIFGNLLSVTAGIAWVMESRRSAINPRRPWDEVYRADLVSSEHDYIGFPIGINLYCKVSSWNGFLLHAQTVLSEQGIRWNAGMSMGLGIFPSGE